MKLFINREELREAGITQNGTGDLFIPIEEHALDAARLLERAARRIRRITLAKSADADTSDGGRDA